MLGRSPLQLGLIAVGLMLAAFFISFFLGLGFSRAILILIAAAGFLTIVLVMILGSQHSESPMSASDSHAVSVWNERVAKRRQAQASAEENSAETSSE